MERLFINWNNVVDITEQRRKSIWKILKRVNVPSNASSFDAGLWKNAIIKPKHKEFRLGGSSKFLHSIRYSEEKRGCQLILLDFRESNILANERCTDKIEQVEDTTQASEGTEIIGILKLRTGYSLVFYSKDSTILFVDDERVAGDIGLYNSCTLGLSWHLPFYLKLILDPDVRIFLGWPENISKEVYLRGVEDYEKESWKGYKIHLASMIFDNVINAE